MYVPQDREVEAAASIAAVCVKAARCFRAVGRVDGIGHATYSTKNDPTMCGSPMTLRLPRPEDALPGRDGAMTVPAGHFVHGRPLVPPFPAECAQLVVGMGCFWGAERIFWEADGVFTTAVGYAGGYTQNPTYREVCSGMTGHTEVVLVVYDPQVASHERVLGLFWEHHDPTQGMRQGNDAGTQYRSAVYCPTREQLGVAETSRAKYQDWLTAAGFGRITTDIAGAQPLYYAEDYHQQYLAKNPSGYCGLGGTGVTCPTGLSA